MLEFLKKLKISEIYVISIVTSMQMQSTKKHKTDTAIDMNFFNESQMPAINNLCPNIQTQDVNIINNKKLWRSMLFSLYFYNIDQLNDTGLRELSLLL